jgi:hypothetical protein
LADQVDAGREAVELLADEHETKVLIAAERNSIPKRLIAEGPTITLDSILKLSGVAQFQGYSALRGGGLE